MDQAHQVDFQHEMRFPKKRKYWMCFLWDTLDVRVEASCGTLRFQRLLLDRADQREH